MVGTLAGGKKAAATNKAKYGPRFYANIGQRGGQNGHTGGFASNHELAVRAGSLGGTLSRRGKGYQKEWAKWKDRIEKEVKGGTSLKKIAEMTSISYNALIARVKKEGWEYKGEEE